MNRLPDNLPKELTGAELLRIGTGAYEDAGYPFPDAWEELTNANWSCVGPIYLKRMYRIKPALLEPVKPRVRLYQNTTEPYWCIELTGEIRERLGDTAGVDWKETPLNPYTNHHLRAAYNRGVIDSCRAVAAASVGVDDGR